MLGFNPRPNVYLKRTLYGAAIYVRFAPERTWGRVTQFAGHEGGDFLFVRKK